MALCYMQPLRRGLPLFLAILLGERPGVVAFFGAAFPNLFRDSNNVTRPRCSHLLAAARGGGDGRSDQSNASSPPQPSLKGDEDEVLPPHFQTDATVAWVQLVLDSFEETFAGEVLVEGLDREFLSPSEQAREVAVADVAVISHDFLRNAEDPIFIYGRRCTCILE